MSKLDLNQPVTKIKVGISQCLLGDKVRYDGGDKCLSFAVNRLKSGAEFYAICPEMSIGLPSPRPTLGLYQCKDKSIIMRFNDTQLSQQPINDKMQQFCQQILPDLSDLSGYIVCAKSPSCGLMNARVYDIDNNDFIKISDGVFTANIRKYYPWMPIEDNINLEDSSIQIHFMIRLLALQRLNKIKNDGLTRHALIAFHSRYKSLLLAHSQPKYRELGPFVANIGQWEHLDDFFYQYRQKFMELLTIPASRENHTNVLMHLQGYFNRYLSPQQKQNLTHMILTYRKDELSLDEPIKCLKNYLLQFPNDYLSLQYYLDDYPSPF